MTRGEAESIIQQQSSNLVEGVNVVYENCVQVHPWLVKRSFVHSVGYFDPQFSPQQFEDDDLFLRMRTSGWIAAAIRVRACTRLCTCSSVPQTSKRGSVVWCLVARRHFLRAADFLGVS
ncbi:MAG: hypothetical protein EOO65_01440 [Methanosarcinales archaeon]|nr:MAG: hypothetical protein EOO65_01440 [Methanosarcinales archaeon]